MKQNKKKMSEEQEQAQDVPKNKRHRKDKRI